MSGKATHVRTSLALLLGVLVLAGCGGGGPSIDKATAVKLAREADAVAAAGNACAALPHAHALQRQAIASINTGRIPAVYQEPLQARVNEIAATLELRCLPTPTAPTAASTVPPPAVVVPQGKGGGKGHDKHHGDGGGD